jgi:hypothetical protein
VKVYVVLSCPKHGDTAVEGVFDTRDAAESFATGFHDDWNMTVEEREVKRRSPHDPTKETK